MTTLTYEKRAQVKEARDLAARERLPRTASGQIGRDGLADRCLTLTGGDGHQALLLAIHYLRLTQKP